MMLFGRTLFGGAGTGLVMGAGVALCAALAQGDAQVSYSARASAVTAAAVSGEGLRAAIAGGEGHVAATVSGHPLASYLASGIGAAQSDVCVVPTSALYGAGQADSGANIRALAHRQVRMRLQPPARAYAFAEAEGVFYAYAYGRKAVARAYAFGTTYDVGRGSATANALATGAPEWIVGAKQNAVATADGDVLAHVEAGAIGVGLAHALGFTDAAVRRHGVLYYECFGSAHAAAKAHIDTVSVYQSQIALAFAHASALPIQARGFKGRSTGYATGYGNAVTMQTGATGTGHASAGVFGQGIRLVAGAGLSQPEAALIGAATTYLNGRASGAGRATLGDHGTAYGVTGRGAASASVVADGVRGVAAEPAPALGVATATGFNQINDLTQAPSARTMVVAASNRIMLVGASARLMRVAA